MKPRIRITIELEGNPTRGDLAVHVKSLDQGRMVTHPTWINSLSPRCSFDIEGSEEILVGIGQSATARI